MKIQCPQNCVSESEGFTKQQDIFKRKEFGESLSRVIKNSSGELVIALDAKWGEGKSTFIQMWKNDQGGKLPILIYDAFRNDRTEDPFLSIASHIYSHVEDIQTDAGPKVLERAKDVAKIFLRASASISLKAATAGALDGTAFENLKVDDDIAKTLAHNADKIIEARLLSVKSDEQCVVSFKKSLQNLASELSESGKLVFVIDELDRCRPDYALDVLEVVKHFFSVENVVFLFSLNREQLEVAICHRYGANINANLYLQKFVGLWVNLPAGELGRSSHRDLYIAHMLEKMEFNAKEKVAKTALWSLTQMAQHYEMSLREIERFLTTFAVFFNEVGGGKYTTLYELGIVIAAIKVKHPDVFKSLAANRLGYNEIIEQAELNNLIDHDHWGNRDQQHRLRWILYVYLMPDEDKHEYISKNNYTDSSNYLNKDAVLATCRVLGSFGRYI